jgi:predicted adenylyl cyclase CyaB
MIEVELKARVRDRAAVETALRNFAVYVGEIDKRDIYWRAPSSDAGVPNRTFRVRYESGACVVTFKHKSVEGGAEINIEREFGVSDPDVFAEFAQRLGCELWYEKRKRGLKFETVSKYAYDGKALLEIVDVENLGCFIEIEELLHEDRKSLVEDALSEISGLLARTGLSETDIESRYYSELLGKTFDRP